MPCGGSYVFRRVSVESTGYLDDRRVRVGLRQENVAYKEDPRFEHIAGSFSDPGESSERYYYIGKYELTRLQYAALQNECSKPSTALRLPVTELSWFDAVNAGRIYTEWLMQNASDVLPKQGSASAFVRLPTEIEWEFAARGGLSVDEADFSGRVFPMPDGQLSEYVWFQGSESAAGKLRPIGLLKPNPLGLYDILGNASEITFDLFHLNRRGRLHGQAGGFVSKGGDIATSQGEMRSALRNENQFFDTRTGEALKVANMGARFVLSVPVVVSADRLQAIQSEWKALPAPDLESDSSSAQREALARLSNVTQRTDDQIVKQQLEQAILQLESARTIQNDIRNRAIRALLQSGAIIGNKVKTDPVLIARTEIVLQEMNKNLARAQELFAQAESAGDAARAQSARAVVAKIQSEMESRERRIVTLRSDSQTTVASYSDLVYSVSSDYPLTLIAPQLEALVVDYREKGFGYLVPFAQLFVGHVEELRSNDEIEREKWSQELRKIGGNDDQ
ncbi:MAG: SUMF1/EgtB/PvdO family nonheme iron enzyme [Parvibaculum sp.]|nr:SUMF1/EgtB/PvdO family nonheme iron enzyme [Parvibaculum sp.]MCW5726022.1 SUMF1/EgtB/PvdO family nonheme iron enzyme [Parvibaculum sp.]